MADIYPLGPNIIIIPVIDRAPAVCQALPRQLHQGLPLLVFTAVSSNVTPGPLFPAEERDWALP